MQTTLHLNCCEADCMDDEAGIDLLKHLAAVPDPRVERTRHHELGNILAIALCAVIGGADHWTEVVEFANGRRTWFESFLKLPNGVPSHDTFARVFRLINPDTLELVCRRWLTNLAAHVKGVVALEGKSVLAIDGKSVRGARDGKKPPLHMVSAWASDLGLLLGQVRTAEKSNEITAIPELLKLLDLHGCIVTIDAMGCQKAICKEIVAAGADYVLGLKSNHPHFYSQTQQWFAACQLNGFARRAHSHYLQADDIKAHGRIETREHWLMPVPKHLQRVAVSWKGLKSLLMVRRTRQVGETISCEDSYYISNLPVSTGAQVLANAVRRHWAVENELHWSLDVAFREDESQVRKDHAPANLACIRRLALTQLKQEAGKKLGIQGKRRSAGWDTNYLERVLGMRGI